MKFRVIYWKEDPAAQNIVNQLESIGISANALENSILFSEEPEIETDLFLVASMHKSAAKRPALTVHPTGNWGPAEAGGNEHELSFTSPAAMKIGLKALSKSNLEGFEITREVTHHGPTNWKTPLVFIEIGSSEKEWKNEKAGEIIAHAISEIQDSEDEFENHIGFGGGHYCPAFTPVLLRNEEIAIGHIAPKYAVPYLDEKIVEEALKKSNAEKAVIDWKGLKSEKRKKVLNILESLGIDWMKTKEL